MKVYEFRGSYYDIGKQQGLIYKKKDVGFEHVYSQDKVVRTQIKVYKKYYPKFLEQCNGIAESVGCEVNDVLYYFIALPLSLRIKRLNLDKGCTICSVKNKNGFFVGRNYDWVPIAEKVFKMYKVINPKRNSYLAVSDMDVFSSKIKNSLYYVPEDVINSKGLYVGITYAYDERWSYGLLYPQVLSLIAETCDTVDDALKLFKKLPVAEPKNFFIADRYGNSVVVEHTSKKYRIIYPKNNVLIHTNDYVDSALAKEDAVLLEKPVSDTFIRYYETLQKINIYGNRFDLAKIIKIFGNKKLHILENKKDSKTIWCLALDMKRKLYKIYYHMLGKRKCQLLKV